MKFYIRVIAALFTIYLLTEWLGGFGLYLFLFMVVGYILYHTKS